MHGAIACLAAIALGGCGDERAQAPPAPAPARVRAPPPPPRASSHDECVAAAAGDLSSPGTTLLGAEVNARLQMKRAQLVLRLCTEDGWPADVTRCYAEAHGLMELGSCWLPPAMSTRLTDELQGLMRTELGL